MAAFAKMRKSQGFTQASLSKALGVDQSTVCLWEKGRTFPRPEAAFRLAALFGCSIDDIIHAIRDSTNFPAESA